MNVLNLRRPRTVGLGEAAPLPAIGLYAHRSWPRRHRGIMYAALIAFCLLYGAAITVSIGSSPVLLAVPLAALAGIALWVAPDSARVPEWLISPMLTIFLFALLCWPDYIALALPGLPWITAIRLTGYPLMAVLLVCVAMSSGFRGRMAAILGDSPLLWKMLLGFVLIGFLSVGLSNDIGFSLSKFVVAQMAWTSVFFAACYAFARPGQVRRFAYYLWALILYSCAIGMFEAHYSRLPWADHIPSFLKIEDENIEAVLAGIARAASGSYRVQSKFGTSIGLGEFFGMALPFVLHLMMTSRSMLIRLAIAATVPMIAYVVFRSDSRLGLINFLGAFALYGLFWLFRRWRARRESIFTAAFVFAYPVVLAVIGIMTLAWRRLHVAVLGGGAQQFSTDSRIEQYEKGIPLILQRPVGYGFGKGGDTLGFISTGGTQTIDTYYIEVALEFGVIGFIVYYGMFLLAAFRSGAIGLKAPSSEILFLGPACIALINFVVSKSVYSQQENHPLAFMLLGLVVALTWRYRQEQLERDPAARALVAPGTF